MNLEETILDKVRSLPPAGQERVLRFAFQSARNGVGQGKSGQLCGSVGSCEG